MASTFDVTTLRDLQTAKHIELLEVTDNLGA